MYSKNNMSEEELNQFRKRVQIESFVYTRSYLWIKLFEAIYNRYEHDFSEEEFAEKIFYLNKIEFFKLRNGELIKVYNEINIDNMHFSAKVLETIRECLITFGNIPECVSIELQIPIERAEEYINELLSSKTITMEECGRELARRMYKAGKTVDEIYYEVWLKEEEINEVIQEENQKRQQEEQKRKVLQIGGDNLKKEIEIKSEAKTRTIVPQQEQKKETIEEELSEKQLKRIQCFNQRRIAKLPKIEEKVKTILEEYDYLPKNMKFIEGYINECRELFDDSDFPEEKIDLLCDCMIFAQSGFESILFLTKVCISHRKYKKAVNFINDNIDNEGMSSEDRKKLNEIKKQLNYSIQKEVVTDMILAGNINIKELSKVTGVLEVDVLHIRNSILRRKKAEKAFEKRRKGEMR